MNVRKYIFAGVAIVVVVGAKVFAEPAAVVAMPTTSPVNVTTNADLARLVSRIWYFTRLTEKPVLMDPEVAMACAPPQIQLPANHVQLLPKKSAGNAVFQVYVTADGMTAMTAKVPSASPGSAISFPIGVVILKQKFTDPEAKSPVLYTGMIKREKGFNPECGDWEFFVVNGDASAILARGRIESCMDCHKSYPQSDFVTRDYPIKPVAMPEKKS